MGGNSRKKERIRKLSPEPSTSSSNTSSASSSSDENHHIESSSRIRRRRREKDRDRVKGRRIKKSRRDNDKDSEKKHKRRYRNSLKRRETKKRKYHSEESSSEYDSDSEAETAEDVVKFVLNKFPAVAEELEQLLRMIDEGQAVDISGLSEKSLVKHLQRLFLCLNLEDSGDKVFLLPHKANPTLDVVGPIISSFLQSKKYLKPSDASINADPVAPDTENGDVTDKVQDANKESVGTQRRVIGPEMPSVELLAAAAKLTEAEAELREAELEGETGFFIGPPPPAVVKEAASANEAERFEEITRIIGAAEDNPYDVLGVNNNMIADNMKKRYWKLSLMVHPDKCTHTQAQQAFVKLNKAFKDLQDPDKRKALDDKIKMEEEQKAFQVELKAMREAAQWRRLQGISMEGDEMLLAQMEVKAPPKREDWMTTLPPERKPATGMSMKSTTSFSKNSKEGRGDTSAWTDTPSERAQKAKTNYLEAYKEAAALASSSASKEMEKKADAELVDKYKEKRSKSLVEKHQEEKKKTKKSKRQQDEWEGKHPWKPWDREKDLTAGRQNVKLDPDNMSQGLSSRFSSGFVQRNFL